MEDRILKAISDLKSEMEQRFDVLEQAIEENRQAIEKNRQAIHRNRQEIRSVCKVIESMLSNEAA